MDAKEQAAAAEAIRIYRKGFGDVEDIWLACSEYHRQQAAEAESQALLSIAGLRVVEDLRNREQEAQA